MTATMRSMEFSCEGAQDLLRADGELGLAEVALGVGLSDQSQFSLHFKRIVGVTPRQFRISARTP
jgi:AraC family transcriptional regulator